MSKNLNDFVTLGRSGLRVSPLCLGTMTFGNECEGTQRNEVIVQKGVQTSAGSVCTPITRAVCLE